MSYQEPVIGTLSPAELGDDRSEPWLAAPAPQAPPPAPLAPSDPEEEARLLAQSLGALIREDAPAAVISAPISAVTSPPPAQPAPDLWAEGFESRPTTEHPYPTHWLTFRRLLDLVGMSLAFLLFWIAYRAFVALPQAPDQSPWARLGSARLEATPTLNGAVASAPGKNLPPIGQFDFGQSVPPEALPALAQQQPVELYRSIYELEDAFEAKYVPPPTCAGLDVNNAADPTDCVNHRLRARRAFLASNGRSMVPEEAPWARTSEPGWEMESGEPWPNPQ